jgi:hypothetical protein
MPLNVPASLATTRAGPQRRASRNLRLSRVRRRAIILISRVTPATEYAREPTPMASCSAGECSCECGPGEGCGCIALSDSPGECECHCYGAGFGGGLTLGLNEFVDVSISGLSLHEAAKFLDSVHLEQVLVPVDILNKLNKRVHVKAKRTRFADVLKTLGLASGGVPRKKSKPKAKRARAK